MLKRNFLPLGDESLLGEDKGPFCQIAVCALFSNREGEDFPRSPHTKSYTRRYTL